MRELISFQERIARYRSYYRNHPQMIGELPRASGAYDAGPISMTIGVPLADLLIIYCRDQLQIQCSSVNQDIAFLFPFQGQSFFHTHDFIEVLYVVEGSFDQILLGERLHFARGEVVITDQNCTHADYLSGEDAAVLFLQIRTDYLDRILRSYEGKDDLQNFLFHSLRKQRKEQSFLELIPAAIEKGTDEELEDILLVILEEMKNRRPGSESILYGLLVRLFAHLCDCYSLKLHSDSREGKEKAILFEVEKYIRQNASTVTIQDLEQRFHYHRNYYNVLLQKYRGLSFRSYTQKIRMEYARQLLTQSDLPVRQIALQCGYENSSFFYHLFSSHFGMTPAEMRGGAEKPS